MTTTETGSKKYFIKSRVLNRYLTEKGVWIESKDKATLFMEAEALDLVKFLKTKASNGIFELCN
jgi:hypothetical protein